MSSKKNKDQSPAPNYKWDLKKRRTKLIKEIKELDQILYIPNVKLNDEWFKNHKKLNYLNIDLMTVKSRLKNIGKFNGGIVIMKVDSNQINKK